MAKKPSKEITEADLPDWAQDIEVESLQNALNAGQIFPTMKPQLNRVYKVKCLSSKPKEIKTEIGKAHVIDLSYEEMNYSLIIPMSFKFNLLKEMLRLSIDDLTGVQITFQKTKQKTKQYGIAEMYSVQLE